MRKKNKPNPKPYASMMLREYYPLSMPNVKLTGSAMLRQYVYRCSDDEYMDRALSRILASLARKHPTRPKKS